MKRSKISIRSQVSDVSQNLGDKIIHKKSRFHKYEAEKNQFVDCWIVKLVKGRQNVFWYQLATFHKKNLSILIWYLIETIK